MLNFFKKKTCPFPILYLIIFIASLHFALTIYINSSFLSTFLTDQMVGVIYTVSSFLAIIAMTNTPILLRKLGNYRTYLLFMLIEMVALLGLAFFDSLYFILPIFIINQILISVTILNTDIFLEACSTDATTGALRGIALTVASIAFLIGPAVAGFILTNGDFWKIFLLSALLVIPVLFLTAFYFKSFQDPEYVRKPFFRTFFHVLKHKDFRSIFAAGFLLRFFYSWMVIYTPIYLYQYVGFDWSTIGIIFFVMILPFTLLEIPLGRIADRVLGEKEILTAGFIIMAIFCALIGFTDSINPAWWAFLLFGTRVGASAVEIMSETYFFKLIDEENANLISLFRDMRPLAYIIAPIMAAGALFFVDLQYTFVLLAIVMLLGVIFSLSIKDTR